MAFSPKLLTGDEHVEVETRTHIKVLLGPAVLGVALLAVLIAALSLLPQGSARPWLLLAVVVLVIVAGIVWVVVPVLRWRTTIFVVTNRRLITRRGILNKSGRDIPLYRITDVAYDKGVLDRILGCGTLKVSDASEQPALALDDIPRVEQVQIRISELLFAHDGNDDLRIPPTARGTIGQVGYELPYDQEADHRRYENGQYGDGRYNNGQDGDGRYGGQPQR